MAFGVLFLFLFLDSLKSITNETYEEVLEDL